MAAFLRGYLYRIDLDAPSGAISGVPTGSGKGAEFVDKPKFDDSSQKGKEGKLDLQVGETYQMKIIKLIPAERKIGLSIRALKNEEFRADWEAYAESTGRPEVTLGDHFKHQQ